MLTNYQHLCIFAHTQSFLSFTDTQKGGSLRDNAQGHLFCPPASTLKTACEKIRKGLIFGTMFDILQ